MGSLFGFGRRTWPGIFVQSLVFPNLGLGLSVLEGFEWVQC